MTHDEALHIIEKEALKQQADPDGLHFCPRCGEEMDGIARHAVSRNADIIICDACGQTEAIEALIKAGLAEGEVLPIEEWAVVRGAYHIYAEEDADGWKVSIPETGATGRCEQPSDIISTGEMLKNQ